MADVAQLLNSSTSQQQELRVVLQPALQYSQEQYEAYPYEIPTNRAVGARASGVWQLFEVCAAALC